ncbi:MAG: hypothetical protein E7396_03380 [Ruminococcaceae bacterium]|nr:hypothetical protein [Oscillospiraceae bacterium]
MFDISKIDANFKVETKIEKEDIKFYDADDVPFKIYGVYREGDRYRRMPENVAKSVSEGVYSLHSNTAGGRVRFVTDSPYVAIHAKIDKNAKMAHFPFTGSMGFDLYADNIYINTFVPPFNTNDILEKVIDFNGINGEHAKTKEITINFPLYSDVLKLYIGLKDGCIIEEAAEYKNEKPVVFYGSSITQGGCASRPGTCYQAILSRNLNMDYINLGFSGSAKAEDEMIDYIMNLDMSVFVFDYDNNAPTSEHLKNTHEKMFKAIRYNHPSVPVIMMPRPKYYLTDSEKINRSIIEATYRNAVNNGDKNVYYISNEELTSLCKNEGTVDNCHPTDFGFASMAEALEKVFRDNHLLDR